MINKENKLNYEELTSQEKHDIEVEHFDILFELNQNETKMKELDDEIGSKKSTLLICTIINDWIYDQREMS